MEAKKTKQKVQTQKKSGMVEKVAREAKHQSLSKGEIAQTPKSKQNVTSKQTSKVDALSSKDKSSSSSTCARSNDHIDIPSLGSAWVHNGRRDEAAEWRLVNFQPMWEVKSDDVDVQLPVSVQAADAGVHLVIKQSFLSLELMCDRTRERGRSLDTCLRGRRH
jgi:hypothetical protein